ncbi:MAG: ABC transporter substrate-binding protein [Hyphomicrobiaceae bacterium]
MQLTSVCGPIAARPFRARRGLAATLLAAMAAVMAWAVEPAAAADPAVQYMERVGRELLAAARSRSPSAMAQVVARHADTGSIGLYSLGTYRAQLAITDRPHYLSGMVRFIARYAANEAPKYPVARVEWMPQSVQGGQGLMVDSKVTLTDGTAYDVRWLLARYGNTYKVRDAMVYGLWMTPFLKNLFEGYIGQNGGNVKALVVVLNR